MLCVILGKSWGLLISADSVKGWYGSGECEFPTKLFINCFNIIPRHKAFNTSTEPPHASLCCSFWFQGWHISCLESQTAAQRRSCMKNSGLYCTAKANMWKGKSAFLPHSPPRQTRKSRLTFLSFRRIYLDKTCVFLQGKHLQKRTCFTESQHEALAGSCYVSLKRERMDGFHKTGNEWWDRQENGRPEGVFQN